MPLKNFLIATGILAVCAWAAFVVISLSQLGESLPGAAMTNPPASNESLDLETRMADSVSVRPADGEATPPTVSVIPAESVVDRGPATSVRRIDAPCTPDLVTSDRLTNQCACGWRGLGLFINEAEIRVGGGLAIQLMTDDELKAFADAGDHGYAQFIYAADRLLDLAASDESDRQTPMERAAARAGSSDDELFETAKLYLIEAARNHNRAAAGLLSQIFCSFDRIEARAWLVIDRESGGSALAGRETSEEMGTITDPYTEYEKEQSAIRAQEIIAEFDLATDLGPPAACLLSIDLEN